MTFLPVSDLLLIAKWFGITTLLAGALTTIAFILSWGWRFRMVGVTSFMGVLTASFFGLGVSLYPRIAVEGAERFSVVYDNGGAQLVVALPPQALSEETLRATLKQAAYDSFSPGRYSSASDGQQMTIRARTILHQAPGISEPLLLGQVRRSLQRREDEAMDITVFADNLAKLPTASQG
jgi:hypothetical protein